MTRPGSKRPADLTEAEVVALFATCSNTGRWGTDDELGTLNLIGAHERIRAVACVRRGEVVSLAHPLEHDGTSVVHRMLASSPRVESAQDVLEIAPHGFGVTHVDALGHVAHGGRQYNDRLAAEAIAPDGLKAGSIYDIRNGIVTRGFLLDIAGVRGVPCLEPDATVEPEDLDAAVTACEEQLQPGDAVLVRIGMGAREYRGDPRDTVSRPGLSPRCIPWLRHRDVAVYGGDCVERLPSGFQAMPMPFHAIGLASMGLCVLDNVDMEAAATACATFGRRVFMLVAAPLPIRGGTGSAVNPLALF